MDNKLKSKIIIIALAPIIFILNIITKSYPELIEKYYSTGIDKAIRQGLSIITGIFPFSAAEFLVITFVIILMMSLIILIIKIVKGGFVKQFTNVLAFASSLYIIFMIFWGFNYNRVSFDKIASLKIEKSSKEDLYKLCENLIARANTLRGKVYENTKGIMTIQGGYKDVFKREALGYDAASKIYPELGGKYGPPKRILLSEKMSYTGITGIYMPYTGEPNVNINVTDFMLPATAAHEMAHQRGFAREDEANYIAYVTCSMHPDYDFQYSGVMLAVIYSMNALADNDIESYKQLAKTYSEGVRRDIIYDSEFWQRYKGKTEKITNQVNNTYLKSNGQKDGVQSYGRMVDLLLAEYKKK
ncbi:hypothetical protein HMPREF1982_02733 [Clostridiales bacterium oral taxon 876 str. F0540]|nr:hypothetical protein HMPREF1982_02733 [Clostridiales bacterium oral taxon 876 str. F0540]